LFALLPDLLQLFSQGLDITKCRTLCLPSGTHGVGFRAQIHELAAQLLQPGLACRVFFVGKRGLLDLHAGHASGQLVEFGGHRVDLGTQHRAGLVDQINGLVGEIAVGDVAVAQCHCGDQRTVEDLDSMEDLEAFP
jgi:hypothetical protein